MKLFTVGPVEMFDAVKDVRRNKDVPYFRTQEFSALMLDTDKLLKKFIGTTETSDAIYLTGSGTAAMEATIMNCFSKEDNLLIINGGTFGQRFVDICNIHRIPHVDIELEYDEKFSSAHLEKFKDVNLTGLLVNIDETSTGQLYDIKILSEFCRQKNIFFVVDAISSFLCDAFDMDAYGADAVIVGSQKGLCVEPGMSIVVLSKKIMNERVLRTQIESLYFDFKIYKENFKRGQTPFTPAVGICMELNASLHMIDNKGLENHLKEIEDRALDFRQKVSGLPVTLPKYSLSNAITPVIFNENIAYRVFEILKDRYEIMVNPTGGNWHNKSLRVTHIGQLTKADNDLLVRRMSEAIAEIYHK